MSTSIHFVKYQATGNDFILIDNRNDSLQLNIDDIKKITHRKLGIGADGILLLQNHTTYDFEVIYYNPDGSKSFCANGTTCMVGFSHHLKIIGTHTKFLAYDGAHQAYIQNHKIHLALKNIKKETIKKIGTDFFINTGSPHYVKFVENIHNYNVVEEGKIIRYSHIFGNIGTNVNFVEYINQKEIFVRTFEKGVENETLSCGTGAVASALIVSESKNIESPLQIITKGGSIEVEFIKKKNEYTNIYITNTTNKIFEGIISLNMV
ncbi:MAG: diaminopimelate epimerase [Chitinophagaceae bacterium]|nr:diaminopimelate epimerase [Chitinophagaceae bacterium]